MKFEITKIDAAVDLLDWAIKLFLDKSAYVAAITLAGAAEEIIGGAIVESSVSRQVKESLKSNDSQEKNWLIQWRDMGDEETTGIELETEAMQYIVRAITSLFAHDQSLSSESPRFLEWLNKSKPEILDGLEFHGNHT